MSHSEEIERLLEIARDTEDLKIVNNVIFNLAAYGPKSIPAINRIIDDHCDLDVRRYGRETIEQIKERSRLTPDFSRHY
jgi:hypothetical protein